MKKCPSPVLHFSRLVTQWQPFREKLISQSLDLTWEVMINCIFKTLLKIHQKYIILLNNHSLLQQIACFCCCYMHRAQRILLFLTFRSFVCFNAIWKPIRKGVFWQGRESVFLCLIFFYLFTVAIVLNLSNFSVSLPIKRSGKKNKKSQQAWLMYTQTNVVKYCT